MQLDNDNLANNLSINQYSSKNPLYFKPKKMCVKKIFSHT